MLHDIGGRRLFLEVAGAGGPTVVLEAGAGNSGRTWDPIWTPLSAFTRVCRYDRPNLGQSDPSATLRSASDVAADLHTLLRRAGVPGPYVMVGHSFGGLVVRLYAYRYPEQVVGAVLIDSSHPQQSSRSLPLLPPAVPSEEEAVTAARNRYRDPETTLEEGVNFGRSLAEADMTGSLGDLPLMVLTRSLPTDAAALGRVRPGLPPEIALTAEHLWQELQTELAGLSQVSTHLVADQSGHYLHQDQPAMVVDAIRRVVDLARMR